MRFRDSTQRRMAAIALGLFLLSGPVAALSHDHGRCCGGHARESAATADAGNAQTRPKTSEHRHACCRFSSCRAGLRAAHASADKPYAGHGGDQSPEDRSGSFSSKCSACEFLAKRVAVATWTFLETCSLARWREHPPRRPFFAAPFVASFLARGPPA